MTGWLYIASAVAVGVAAGNIAASEIKRRIARFRVGRGETIWQQLERTRPVSARQPDGGSHAAR